MKYREVIVQNKELKESVLCYWEMTGFIDNEEGVDIRYIPEGQNLLIFNFGNPIEQLDKPKESSILSHPFFIVPAVASSRLFNQKGEINLFGISFIGDGLYRLMQQPISKLKNSIPEILIDKLASLHSKIESIQFEEKIRLTENFLQEQIDQRLGNPSFTAAYEMIKENKGCIKISALANLVHVTERQLQRLFNSRLGISPKDFCKVVRVNSYINYILSNNSSIDWMELVVEFDYHDQPHLVNEVKAIAKLSPKKLMAYRDTLSNYYS